ncbi:DUF6218 family protein [Micromonosporaceae bacterium DT194]|uniref:DUF6218 family protein n=1 Tax=Melissospora conviva TaxID=3388432 RepID=UPI003C215362
MSSPPSRAGDPDDEQVATIDQWPAVRGHVLLAVGPDGDGADALGIWRVGPTGRPDGAWVLTFAEITETPQRLTSLLATVSGRSLVDWSDEAAGATLDRLAGLFPSDRLDALRSSLIVVPDLLAEIVEQRAGYDRLVAEQATAIRRKVVELPWPTEPGDVGRLQVSATRTAAAAATPVAASALSLTAAVAHLAELWHDTERVRCRRKHLLALGEPQPLPPRWLGRLRAAAGTPHDPTPGRN